jgi:hypothetical protein
MGTDTGLRRVTSTRGVDTPCRARVYSLTRTREHLHARPRSTTMHSPARNHAPIDGFTKTGEFRAPLKDEWFVPEGYGADIRGRAVQADVDLPEDSKRFILQPTEAAVI